MATLAEIRNEVSAKLLDPSNETVAAASVVTTINQSIAYYKRKPFWFNEATEDLTLTTGSPIIPLPADFYTEIKPDGFVIVWNERRYPLCKVNSGLYDSYNVESQGLPYQYTYLSGQYLVYLYPDQDYTISVRYLKEYEALSGDDDFNDFTVNADRLIAYDALARAHGEFRQDEKMEAYYSARAADEFKQLQAMNNRKIGSGELIVRSILT